MPLAARQAGPSGQTDSWKLRKNAESRRRAGLLTEIPRDERKELPAEHGESIERQGKKDTGSSRTDIRR